MTSLTRHASTRSVQRGIPPLVIDWVMSYGEVARSRGANTYFLTKRTRKNLEKDIGSILYKRVSDLLDIYVVVGEQSRIITTAHRLRRRKK